MSTTDTPQRDATVANYLAEAFGNEKRLETALQAHIAMTARPPYKRRLRQHLTETRRHATELTRRIKQLGGSPDPIPGPLGDAAGALVGSAHKATALAQAPLHALRGRGEAERQLKNARTEYAEEAQEIGMYSAIEALAVAVADKETAQLARKILRDERRMLAFLEREIPRLSTAVARSEVPASQRNGGTRRSSRATKRTRSATTSRTRTTRARQGSARSGARARAGSGRGNARTRAGGARART
jgi:ferritin-like metal-binding protein YciE